MLTRYTSKATNAVMFSLVILVTANVGNHDAHGAEFFFHDSFESEHGFDQNWHQIQGAGTAGVSDGDARLESPDSPTFWDLEPDGVPVSAERDWSFRALVTPQLTEQGEFWLLAIGTSGLRHAGFSIGNNLRAGRGEDPRNRRTLIPYDVLDTQLYLQMDAFGEDVRASAWKPGDPSSLVQVSQTFESLPEVPRVALWVGTATFHDVWISTRSIPLIDGDYDLDGQLDIDDLAQISTAQQDDLYFDLTGDRLVDFEDHRRWVRDLKYTWYGDANFDGEFTSSDFIQVFQAGTYEIDADASWGEGDWNNDRRFDSADFVTAFQDGGYEIGPRPNSAVVPEPSGLLCLGVGCLWPLRRRLDRND